MEHQRSDFKLLPTDAAFIEMLPQRMQRVLALSDRSYADIAAEIGCPLGTIKSRLNRARSRVLKLREEAAAIEPNNFEPFPSTNVHGG